MVKVECLLCLEMVESHWCAQTVACALKLERQVRATGPRALNTALRSGPGGGSSGK